MHLSRLELNGFKSFAEKTTLNFLPPQQADNKGITAVVGPNGSGKSNVADAIRWVLGEQSLKLIRGKKAEDVIFSGSEKRGKSGFAEVTMHLNNEDGQVPLEYSEVAITRRIYRDGESEYLINKNIVRLADVHLLLAQAQIGARSYSVIGQGMADHILTATPEERKEFFDEAAGVRQFQIKKNQSENKLKAAKENLSQAELLITEIEPRLKSLNRQVERLNTRATVEEDLHALRHAYYGKLWHDITTSLSARQATLTKAEQEWKAQEKTIAEAKTSLATLRETPSASEDWKKIQAHYEKLSDDRRALERELYQLQSKLEIAREVQKQTQRAPLPLSKIIAAVGTSASQHASALEALKASASLKDAHATIPHFESAHKTISELRDNLEQPAPAAPTKETTQDPAVAAAITETQKKLDTLTKELSATQQQLRTQSEREQNNRAEFITLQRALEDRLSKAYSLERTMSDARVELARVETRRDALLQEMSAELGERTDFIIKNAEKSATQSTTEPPEALQARIQKLKYNLELIGGIDPQVAREYEETKARFEHLDTQVTDLRKAITDLEHLISELDMTITAKSRENFRTLNHDFNRFFTMLFGGGKAELIEVTKEATEEDAQSRLGIDIIATPPGKKIKNIAMLSGGERTLIAIALISAIMVTNPSPFVVLDEVDAALDESNAEKFANIIAELSEKTQFIVITHNRYTMRRASVLYGVTMRDDGTSQLLSVNLDQLDTMKKESAKNS